MVLCADQLIKLFIPSAAGQRQLHALQMFRSVIRTTSRASMLRTLPVVGRHARIATNATPQEYLTRGKPLPIQAELQIFPIGVGVSLSSYVAVCEKVLRAAPVNAQMHAFGTNVEGEWNDVMAAVRECFDALHEVGAPRVTASIKIGSRKDKTDRTLADKVASVEAKM